jgi:hypothetical protein
VNTLMLSVFERTHEIGLLRAVGMERRRVKAMIRSESVIVDRRHLAGATGGSSRRAGRDRHRVSYLGDQKWPCLLGRDWSSRARGLPGRGGL